MGETPGRRLGGLARADVGGMHDEPGGLGFGVKGGGELLGLAEAEIGERINAGLGGAAAGVGNAFPVANEPDFAGAICGVHCPSAFRSAWQRLA
jgi:hypothetical protein